MIGKVGDDMFGRLLLGTLQSAGIDTRGILADPGANMPYLQVTSRHTWCDDSASPYYNQLVDVSVTGSVKGEHLIDYKGYYNYCMFIDYNAEGEPGKGSCIFLHCKAGHSTGGCVAIPKEQMLTAMQNVRPDCVVLIDSLENISPETWNDWGLGTAAAGPRIEYGESALFSEEDMDEAIALIRE